MHLSSLRDDAPAELAAPVGAFYGHQTHMHNYSPQGRQVNNHCGACSTCRCYQWYHSYLHSFSPQVDSCLVKMHRRKGTVYYLSPLQGSSQLSAPAPGSRRGLCTFRHFVTMLLRSLQRLSVLFMVIRLICTITARKGDRCITAGGVRHLTDGTRGMRETPTIPLSPEGATEH